MLDTRDTLATTFLLASISGSLYFSAVNPSYLLSLLFCFLEFNAVLFYFFGVIYTPGSTQTGNLITSARETMSNIGQRVQSSLAGAVIQNGYTRMVNGISSTVNR
jgi:hypothetical protein